MKLKFPSTVLVPLLGLLLLPNQGSAYSVNGKRVLVTGSSGGIGRGIAIKLAEEGAEVFVHYNVREEEARETRRLIEDRGGVCAGISQCDFSHPAHIHTLFQQINGVWRDGMDILVNNAGIISKLAVEDDDEYVTQWRDTMNINLNAPRLLSQMALKGMKKRGGGVIINVSSIHGDRSNEYMSSYAVSKAGLDALTRCMAIEFAEHKVRVNAIAPGVVKVERTEEYFRDPANVTPWTDRLLLNEIGSVSHIADATLPLITNDWITGTIWQIDGGMSARSNMPLRTRPKKFTPAKLPSQQAPAEGAPSAYAGERLGEQPMPGQVASSFPEKGYNAGRLADQPMPGQPGFGEEPPPPGRGPGFEDEPPSRRGDPNDPRFMPEEGRRGPMPGPGQPGYREQRNQYGRPEGEPTFRDDPRRDDPRRRQQPYDDRQEFREAPPAQPQSDPGRSMNMPQNGFGTGVPGQGTGGMPGQGYIPRSGPEDIEPPNPDYPNRRSGDPPPRGTDYRPLDSPNDEPPTSGGDYFNPSGPRTHL